jgi:ribosomal protein S18 acetylase RimI-like enzyme
MNAASLVPEDIWEAVEPLLSKEPPKPKGGRPRVSDRDTLAGVASWIPPAHPVVTQVDREAAGLAEVRASWGPEAVARFYDIGANVGEAELLAPTQPHWYLHWLGTEASVQGRGIVSTLVRQVTARADAEDVAYQLLNFVSRNVPIYEHLGFRVILDTVLSRTGLRHWVMARQPPVSP